MEPKVNPAFWVETDGLERDIKLALLWIKTNPETAASNLGVFTVRPRRFAFETGLADAQLEKTLALFPQQFLREGDKVLIRQFVGDQWGRGERLVKNNAAKALVKPFGGLPKPLQEAVLADYPELEPLLSPSKGSVTPYLQGNSPVRSDRTTASPASPYQALGKGPLISEQQSQNISEKEGSGEGTSGAVIPTDAEVLQFAAGYRDLGRGFGPIGEAYALKWFAWRASSAQPFPKRWQEDLQRRWTADVLAGREPAIPATSSTPSGLATQLETERDPEARAHLRKKLREKTPGAS